MNEDDDFPDLPDFPDVGHGADLVDGSADQDDQFISEPKGKYSLSGGENGSYVLELANERWLIGMDWSSVNEIQSKRSIIKKGKEQGFQTALQRDTDAAVQIAYGMPISGLKTSGLHSLAAAIAEGTQQPWRGVYRVGENLWWYIAVRDSFAIVPGSDIVGDAEAIERAKQKDQHLSGWQELIGDIGDLEQLIEEKATKSPKIIRIDKSNKISYIALAVLLGAAGLGYHLWRNHIAEQKHMAFVQHERMVAAAKHRALMEQLQRPPSPLTRIPTANDVLEHCVAVMQDVPTSLYGWQLIGENCGPKGVTIAWKRMPGATLAATPRGIVGPKGDTIVNSESIGLPMKGPDNSGQIQVAVDDLRIILQGADVKSSIIVTIPKAPILTEKEINSGKIPPPPPPPHAAIKFVWPSVPTGVNWDIIPGFRIKDIKHVQKGWQITAVIYGKRPPIQIPASLREKIGIPMHKSGTITLDKVTPH